MEGRTVTRWRIAVTALGLALVVSGCGGGGGSGSTTSAGAESLSGTVAAGAPVVGEVVVKDSTGATRSTVIGSAGAYQIDVGSLTPPFLLQAQGLAGNRSVTMYSAATAADIGHTVNITPLTDLMVAMVTHEAAATYFNAGNFAGIDSSVLLAAQGIVQTQLQPVSTALGLSPAIDLWHASFAANHTGLDAMLDLLQETPKAANVLTVTNRADGSSIACDVTSGTFSGALTAGNVAAYVSAMQQIAGRLQALSQFFATGLPDPTDPDVQALFDQTHFMHDGENFTGFLGSRQLIGMQVASVDLENLGSNQALVGYVLQAGGLMHHAEMYLNWSGSEWLLAGDQHRVDIALNAASYRPSTMSGGMMMPSSAPRSGLELALSDPGSVGAGYAIVTGPGLPTSTGGVDGHGAGVMLFKNASGAFQLAAPGAAYNGTQTQGIASPIGFYVLSDTMIGSLADNASYMVSVYDGSNALLGSYPLMLAKPPYPAASLAATDFPALTMPSNWMMMGQAGGTANISWTLPRGYAPDELRVEQWGTAGEMTVVDPDIAGGGGMAMMTIPPYSGTLSSSFVWFAGADIYGRHLGSGEQIQ